MLLYDKTDDVPPAVTDGNQEGEQSAETLKENIRLIEVCSVLAVYYASPTTFLRDTVLIAIKYIYLLIWIYIALSMTPLNSY